MVDGRGGSEEVTALQILPTEHHPLQSARRKDQWASVGQKEILKFCPLAVAEGAYLLGPESPKINARFPARKEPQKYLMASSLLLALCFFVAITAAITPPDLPTAFYGKFTEFTAPKTASPPFKDGVPDAPFIASRGAHYPKFFRK